MIEILDIPLSVLADAYYMSMNVFNSSATAYLGPQPFAFDRSKMLQGLPATFVTTGITGGSSEETYLPADLDGSTLPPVGAPATFVQWPGTGSYRLFHFHVDFVTPANSTSRFRQSACRWIHSVMCHNSILRTAAGYNFALDAIADSIDVQAARIETSGTHEAVVGNYTVSSGGGRRRRALV